MGSNQAGDCYISLKLKTYGGPAHYGLREKLMCSKGCQRSVLKRRVRVGPSTYSKESNVYTQRPETEVASIEEMLMKVSCFHVQF